MKKIFCCVCALIGEQVRVVGKIIIQPLPLNEAM